MNWTAATNWTLDGLEKNYAEVEVKVGATDDDDDLHMSLSNFMRLVIPSCASHAWCTRRFELYLLSHLSLSNLASN